MTPIGRHEGAVDAILAVGDGWWTAGREGTLRRWPGGEVVARCDDRDWFTSLSTGVAGTARGEVLVLAEDGSIQARFFAMEEGVSAVAAAGHGRFFVCGDDDRVELRAASGERLWVANTSKFPYALALDGTELLVATWDAQLYRVDSRDLPTGTAGAPARLAFPVHPAAPMPFFDVAPLGDGRVAVGTARNDAHPNAGTLHFWSPGATTADARHSLEPIFALAHHEGIVAAAGDAGTVHTFATDGTKLAAIDLPAAPPLPADVWVPAIAEFANVASGHAILSLAFAADGRLLAGTANGTLFELPAA